MVQILPVRQWSKYGLCEDRSQNLLVARTLVSEKGTCETHVGRHKKVRATRDTRDRPVPTYESSQGCPLCTVCETLYETQPVHDTGSDSTGRTFGNALDRMGRQAGHG